MMSRTRAAPSVTRLPSTYWIEVYGCQMNVSDAETIAGILESAGMAEADGPDSADAVLVVTCAVREHAEVRALGRIAQLSGRRHGTGRLTALCGCVAEEHGDSLLRDHPGVDIVAGPDRYADLPRLLASGGGAATGFGEDLYDGVEPVRRDFPRCFTTIMRGCDNMCSYCIVPYVRGPERSRSAASVIGEVGALRDAGYREITLLGQNVNSYRSDGMHFPDLLREAAAAAAPAWVRFVTSHPRDLTEDLVRAMADSPNVCRQIHLPVQSGDDRILSLMNRGYTRDGYLQGISMLRSAMPEIVLSTDMIAGFPGETDEEFERSLDLLAEVRFDYAFLFRYSERPGTPAAGFGGPVPVPVRLERLHRLQEAQKAFTLESSTALEGAEVPVLVTGPGRRPGQQTGRTPGNRTVVFEGGGLDIGAFVLARITSADGWTHFASPVRSFGPGESPPAGERRPC